MTIERRQLGGTGLDLTTLGFGGGPVGWRATPDIDREADDLLLAAWDRGIRYFDTAPYYGYGNSERRIGNALRRRSRDEFVLSSKVGRLIRPGFDGYRGEEQVVYDYSYDGAMRSIEESLERLQLGRIDIALIHDIDRWTHKEAQPQRFREAVDGAYRALTDLKSQGVVRAIGLGVNEWQVCDVFARAVPIDCFLLAGQHSLLRQEAQREFLPFCVEEGIGIIVGGPYNSGILASGAVPGALFDYSPAPDEVLDRVRRIEAVCRRFGTPVAAAALAFTLRHPAVATVIPGVATADELRITADNAAYPIPEVLWTALADEGLVERI
ncbi:MAG: aldo/keto reductase [Verrucomicrobia bacterium]|nr:aldo/keto reductase [Verrucomicrobiota bacterium]